LDGSDLLAYARFRHATEGDFGRVRRQQQVIDAVKDEAVSFVSIFKLPKIAGTGMGYVNTSMSDGEMYRMMASFLVRGDKNIETVTLPMEDTYQFMDTRHEGHVIDLCFDTNKQ